MRGIKLKQTTHFLSLIINILAQGPLYRAPIILVTGSSLLGEDNIVKHNILKCAYDENIGHHNSNFILSWGQFKVEGELKPTDF